MRAVLIATSLLLVVAFTVACGEKKPPMTPDAPDMTADGGVSALSQGK